MTVGCSVTVEGSRRPITIAVFSWGLCGETRGTSEFMNDTEPIESFGKEKVPGWRTSNAGTREGMCREGLNIGRQSRLREFVQEISNLPF